MSGPGLRALAKGDGKQAHHIIPTQNFDRDAPFLDAGVHVPKDYVGPRHLFGLSLLHGDYSPGAPLRAEQDSDGEPGDVVWAGVMLRLLSPRFVQVLEASKATGWTTWPVEIRTRRDGTLRHYRGLTVLGRCENLYFAGDPVDVGRRVKKRKGLAFDRATWDGSDVFCDERKGLILVTERLKNEMEKAKLTNVSFEDIDDIIEV